MAFPFVHPAATPGSASDGSSTPIRIRHVQRIFIEHYLELLDEKSVMQLLAPGFRLEMQTAPESSRFSIAERVVREYIGGPEPLRNALHAFEARYRPAVRIAEVKMPPHAQASTSTHIFELPPELIIRIASFLPPTSIARLSESCKPLLNVCRSPDIWRPICRAIVQRHGWTPKVCTNSSVLVGLGYNQGTSGRMPHLPEWGLEVWERTENDVGIKGWYQLAARFLLPHLKYLGWHASSRISRGALVLITIDPSKGRIVARTVQAVNAFDAGQYNDNGEAYPTLLGLESVRPPLPSIPHGAAFSESQDSYQLPPNHPSPLRSFSIELLEPVYTFTEVFTVVPWRGGARVNDARVNPEEAAHGLISDRPWWPGMRLDLEWTTEKATPLQRSDAEELGLRHRVGKPGNSGAVHLPSLRTLRSGLLKSSRQPVDGSVGDGGPSDLPSRFGEDALGLPSSLEVKGKARFDDHATLLPRIDPHYHPNVPAIVSNAWTFVPREQRKPTALRPLFATQPETWYFPIYGPRFPRLDRASEDLIHARPGEPLLAVSLEGSVWVSSYGPHGLEFGTIALVRVPDPVRWTLEYTKLTGDENVPRGAPSWVATLPEPTTPETIHPGTNTTLTREEVEIPHVSRDLLDGWIRGDEIYGDPDWDGGTVEGKLRLADTGYRSAYWSEADITFVSARVEGGEHVVVDEVRVTWHDLGTVSTFKRVCMP